MPAKLTQDQTVEQFKKVHGDVYNYERVVYKNTSTKVEIICKIHGPFYQTPFHHKQGAGCYFCGKIKNKEGVVLTTQQVIDRFKKVHGDLYDYALVKYKNSTSKIKVICKIHGSFNTTRVAHEDYKRGCPSCKDIFYTTPGILQKVKTKWLDKMKKIWGNSLDFSHSNIINEKKIIEVTCPNHGTFESKLIILKTGRGGCRECSLTKMQEKHSKDFLHKFIKTSNLVHEFKYDYSLVKYKNNKTKVIIKCLSHGEFKQTPDVHLQGSGCPRCCESRGERAIASFLKLQNIEYIFQHFVKIDSQNYYFDFYLPNKNIAIEFDGKQHFEPVKWFGGEKAFEETLRRDQTKNLYCKNNNISLLRISYKELSRIKDILTEHLK